MEHPTIAESIKAMGDNSTIHWDIQPHHFKTTRPIGAAEKRMLYMHKLNPTSTDYHEHASFRFNGNTDAFIAALNDWFSKTSIDVCYSNDEAVKINSFQLEINNHPDLMKPFNLTTGPAAYFYHAPQSNTFHFCFHHISSDEESFNVMFRHIMALYHGTDIPKENLS